MSLASAFGVVVDDEQAAAITARQSSVLRIMTLFPRILGIPCVSRGDEGETASYRGNRSTFQ